MATILPATPGVDPLSRLERLPYRPAKASLKNLDETAWRRSVGGALSAAFKLAGLSQKEVAAETGRDQAQVARWVSGAENAPLGVLFAVEALRGPLVIALAGLADDIDVTTTISVRRRA